LTLKIECQYLAERIDKLCKLPQKQYVLKVDKNV
jgi:hypothetical protein